MSDFGDPELPDDDTAARGERAKEFSRRALLHAGWAVPVVFTLRPTAAFAQSPGGHADMPHTDDGHTDTGHTDTGHTDAHTDTANECVPGNFTPMVAVTEFCGGTSGAAKWAALTFTIPGGGICPCTGTPGTVTAAPPDPSAPDGGWTGTAETSVSDSSGNTIVVKGPGNGSLGQGTYCSTGTLTVAIACQDENGDTVTRRCTFTLCFDFQPAAGNCVNGGVAGNATAVLVGCELLSNV